MKDRLHLETYRAPRPHEVEVPRNGDICEIIRSHCVQESGRLVQVVGNPHLAVARCCHCASKLDELFIEIHSSAPEWQLIPGPWLMPLRDLKRLDPRDRVDYERIKNYAYLVATPEQFKAANK